MLQNIGTWKQHVGCENLDGFLSPHGSMSMVATWTSPRRCNSSSMWTSNIWCCWILGAGNMESATYRAAEAALKQAFQFRTWQKDEPFDYCEVPRWPVMKMEPGTSATRSTWAKFLHSQLKKFGNLTSRWARRSRPCFDNCSEVCSGLLRRHHDICKLQLHFWVAKWALAFQVPWLRWTNFCGLPKATLLCACIFLKGDLEDLRLTCMFNAALGVRHDQSSQGGFVTLLTNKSAYEGVESP